MRRTNNKTILALALLCAGFGACREDEQTMPPKQTYEQGFTGVTRVDGSGQPEHADTYRIMAYATGADLILNTNANQSGSYAYDANEDYPAGGTVGGLVPVTVKDDYTTVLTGDGKLIKNGIVGLHLTAGDYMVSMIHPCVPVKSTGTSLGQLAVFERTDKVYASQPLDKDGDGAEDDPFEINVTANGQLHSASGVVMYPLMSAIRVYFYSHFYAEGSPTPSMIDFTVSAAKLVNAGSNGWYNPMRGIVYPNYNYINKNSYSKELQTSNVGDNEQLLDDAVDDNTLFDRDGETLTAEYVLADIPVFPSDYTGIGDESLYVLPMTLQLQFGMGGLSSKASVPVSIKIERNKLYRFYINVMSEQIGISYTVDGWETGGSDYTGIGGNLGGTLNPVGISWSNSGDWSSGGGGDNQVITGQ